MTPAGWEIERRERTMGEKTDDSLPVIRDQAVTPEEIKRRFEAEQRERVGS
jgi:hypothetical protein